MFPALVLCLVALVMVGISHWVYRWRNPKCSGILPPGSMGFPFIGESLHFFSSHPLDGIPPFIQKRVARYGSLFRTSIVGQPVVVSTDAEVNQYIFQQEGKKFQCWYTESARKLSGEQGLTVHSGVMHKYLRNLALSLVGPENLKAGLLLHEMNEMTRNHLHMWNGRGDLEVKEATGMMIFKLAAKMLLCCDGEMAIQLMNNYEDFTHGFISFPFNIPGTAYHSALKGRRNVLKVIKNAFNERKSTKKSHDRAVDFLDCLLEELEKKEAPLTEAIALDLVFILLFAAYETTSSAITLALKFLNHHPEVLKELKDEHERILENRENKEMDVTWTEYKSMTFSHMVINEAVRLANIVPGIFRKVMEEVEINGKFSNARYTIPAGWTFMVCPPSVHLDSNKYENPFEFNPWRWKGQELHAGSKKFMAFGGGSRLCAGADFAKLQMPIFLHHLLTKYRWKVIKEGNIIRQPGLKFVKGLHIQIWGKERDGETDAIIA